MSKEELPIEFQKIPGPQGSDINEPDGDEHLIALLKEYVEKLNADKLLREYWELLNTKPVHLYFEEHRAWFKKLETYIKIQNIQP